jgi:hypothetical protein
MKGGNAPAFVYNKNYNKFFVCSVDIIDITANSHTQFGGWQGNPI